METKLAKVYYSPGSYWKGIAAIKKGHQSPKRHRKKVADQVGNLADLPPFAVPHPA